MLSGGDDSREESLPIQCSYLTDSGQSVKIETAIPMLQIPYFPRSSVVLYLYLGSTFPTQVIDGTAEVINSDRGNHPRTAGRV